MIYSSVYSIYYDVLYVLRYADLQKTFRSELLSVLQCKLISCHYSVYIYIYTHTHIYTHLEVQNEPGQKKLKNICNI